MSFMDYRDFPVLVPLIEALRARTPELAREAVEALPVFRPSPEVYIQDPADIRLFILPVKWQGKMVGDAVFEPADDRGAACSPPPGDVLSTVPVLRELVQHDLIVSAMYSCSMPGCEIIQHTDNVSAIGDVWRLHLGLRCPPGDCALVVGGEARPWREWDVLMFDSPRVTHSAFNRTDQPRLILIFDVDRAAIVGEMVD